MTVDSLNTIAKSRAGGSTSLERQWVLALQRLASTGLGDAELEKIAASAASPSSVSRLARLFSEDDVSATELFLKCDASHHGLDQWMAALDALYAWLEKSSRRENLSKCLGYVACTSEAMPDADLSWAVVAMLDQYGMDE
jgi:hypothetical protein